MNINERIRHIRELSGLSMAQLSLKINVPKDTISNYELGKRKISIDYITKLHVHLNTCLEWLITGRGNIYSTQEILPDNQSEKFYYVPILTNYVSAGPGCVADKRIIDNFVPMSSIYIEKVFNTEPENLYFMTVNGDSMSPTLLDEDSILINSSVSKLCDNKIYVIQLDDELLVKRAFRKDETTYIFSSDNNKHYQPILVSTSINFKIIGQVIWQSRKIV